MSEPFLAEIRIVGFNFAPRGWAFCDGQVLPINQNQALFSLLGTMYGGDGRTTFALPDLRGRVPMHLGSSNGGGAIQQGQKSGQESITLATAEMPQHNHVMQASSSDGNSTNVGNALLARENGGIYLASAASPVQIQAGMIANAGGSQAHENMQPYLALNFCIALQGLFPSRN